MTCRLALERSKAPIAILLNNASSALERGGASNTPTICWPCGSIVETAAGKPIGQRAAKTCRTPQMKTAQLRHENRQRECITLDRTRVDAGRMTKPILCRRSAPDPPSPGRLHARSIGAADG